MPLKHCKHSDTETTSYTPSGKRSPFSSSRHGPFTTWSPRRWVLMAHHEHPDMPATSHTPSGKQSPFSRFAGGPLTNWPWVLLTHHKHTDKATISPTPSGKRSPFSNPRRGPLTTWPPGCWVLMAHHEQRDTAVTSYKTSHPNGLSTPHPILLSSASNTIRHVRATRHHITRTFDVSKSPKAMRLVCWLVVLRAARAQSVSQGLVCLDIFFLRSPAISLGFTTFG